MLQREISGFRLQRLAVLMLNRREREILSASLRMKKKVRLRQGKSVL